MQEDLKTRVSKRLEEILPRDGSRDFIKADALNEKLEDLWQELKLKKTSNATALKKALNPYLGDDLEFCKGGKSATYLTRKMSPAEIVFNYISFNPDAIAKTIVAGLPMLKKDFVAAINELFAAGRLLPVMYEDYSVKLNVNTKSKPESVPVSNEPVNVKDKNANNDGPVVVTNGDLEAFRAAFVKLDKGNLYVPITELRKELSQWSRDKFDEVLRTLRKNRKIQLHQANIDDVPAEEKADMFIDENGFTMRRVTWYENF